MRPQSEKEDPRKVFPRPAALSRRAFLRRTGAGAIATAGLPFLESRALGLNHPSPHDLQTISIFHTTDIHGHILPTQNYEGVKGLGGLARCADQILRWRAENPHNLVIDVGDLYQGTHVGRRSKGRLMMRLLNKLDYDAWIPGNHDFDWGSDVFAGVVELAVSPDRNPRRPHQLLSRSERNLAAVAHRRRPHVPSSALPERGLGRLSAAPPPFGANPSAALFCHPERSRGTPRMQLGLTR